MTQKVSLITGGAGFIGSHLCEALIKRGHRVICIDNLTTGKYENIKHLLPCAEFDFQKIDVNHYPSLRQLFNHHIDYVFHYAAVVGVKRTEENPLAVLRDIDGIRNVLTLSHEHSLKKVIFASSSEVYGHPVEIPEYEDGHVNAKTPYAVTKLFGEQLMHAYHQCHGLPTTSLRFFNVYGPQQDSSDYGFVVSILIKQALQKQPLTIFGDGSQTRDFVYIDDNIQSTLAALDNASTNGEVINIGTGKPTTILDLANNINGLAGNPQKPQFLPQRAHEIKHRFPDISKMRSLLHYQPQTTIEEGLKKTIDYYKLSTHHL